MMLVPGLNEQKVSECLERNNNGFLYQKCGYLFEEMQDKVFYKRWKLYVPASLKTLIDKGVDDYDAVG